MTVFSLSIIELKNAFLSITLFHLCFIITYKQHPTNNIISQRHFAKTTAAFIKVHIFNAYKVCDAFLQELITLLGHHCFYTEFEAKKKTILKLTTSYKHDDSFTRLITWNVLHLWDLFCIPSHSKQSSPAK